MEKVSHCHFTHTHSKGLSHSKLGTIQGQEDSTKRSRVLYLQGCKDEQCRSTSPRQRHRETEAGPAYSRSGREAGVRPGGVTGFSALDFEVWICTQFCGRLSHCSTGDARVCSLLLSCRPASPSAPKPRAAPAPAPGRLRGQAPPPRPHVIVVPASAKRGPPSQVLAAGPRPASLLPLVGGGISDRLGLC